MSIFSAVTDAVGKVAGDVVGTVENTGGKAMGMMFDAGKAVAGKVMTGFNDFGGFSRRFYTDTVSHPVSALFTLAAQGEYAAMHNTNGSFWNGMNPFDASTWAKAWQESQSVSPGQAIVGWANNAIPDKNGQLNMYKIADYQAGRYKEQPGEKDPFTQGVYGKALSGATDLTVGFKLDPVAGALGAVGEGARYLRNAPIRNGADIERVMSKPSTQKFLDQAGKQSSAKLAEHSMLRDSPLRFRTADVLTSAKSPEARQLAMRVMLGDHEALQALDKINPGTAWQLIHAGSKESVAEVLALQSRRALQTGNVAIDGALSDAQFRHMQDAMAPFNTMKSAETTDLDDLYKFKQQMNDHFSLLSGNTRNSAMREMAQNARFKLKYGNRYSLPDDLVQRGLSQTFKRLNHVPVRIIQPFTDRTPHGFLDLHDDASADNLRSILNKSSVLDSATKEKFVSDFAHTPQDQRQQLLDSMWNHWTAAIGQKYGISSDHAEDLLRETKVRQRDAVEGVVTRRYSAAKLADGTDADQIPTEDGEAVYRPLFSNQIAKTVAVPNLHDLEHALAALQRDGRLATIMRMGHNGRGMLVDVLDKFYRPWRVSNLLHIHRLYNHVGDDLIHAAAKIGASSAIQNLEEGAANFLRNRYRQLTPGQYIRNVEGVHDSKVAVARAEFETKLAQFKTQQADIAAGASYSQPLTTKEVSAFRQKWLDARDEPSVIPDRARLGTGELKISGVNVPVADAFGGPNGAYLRDMNGSQAWIHNLMGDGQKQEEAELYKKGMISYGHSTVSPLDDAKKHLIAWRDAINNHMLQDPVAKQVLQGRSHDQIMTWLRSPEGKAHMERLGRGDHPDNLAAAVEATVHSYLPTRALRELAVKKQVTTKELIKAIPDAGNRPVVDGEMTALLTGKHPAQGYFRRGTDKWMKLTGTLPDDILGRHPFYTAMYRQHTVDLVHLLRGQKGEDITLDEFNRLIAPKAHLMARKDLQATLYDTSRFTDAAHTLRFISPFFNAQWNALQTWSKMFVNNPGLIERASWAYNALQKNFPNINTSTGLPAGPNTPQDQRAIMIQLPAPVIAALRPFTGGGIDALKNVQIPLSSITSVVYGDRPLTPGFGPLVAVPADALAKLTPQVLTDDYVKTFLGGQFTANPLSLAIPSQLAQIGLGQLGLMPKATPDSTSQAQMTLAIIQYMQVQYNNGESSFNPSANPGTAVKMAQDQASQMAAVTGILKFVSPVSFTNKSTYQFYIDQAKQMEAQDPKNWQTNFFQKYGKSMFIMTASLSKNVGGVPATMSAIQAYKKYKSLIDAHPELAGTIIGPEGNGNFDVNAYDYEKAMGMRTQMTPQEALQQNNADLGWVYYNKINALIQYSLQLRGLTSVNQNGAQDLKQFKSDFISSTGNPDSQFYNPDFYSQYGSYDPNKYQVTIHGLAELSLDKSLLSNPVRSDIRALNQYFQYRQEFYTILQQRKAAGGSGSLSASSNSDLMAWWDYETASLQQQSTSFVPIYERYLKKDNLSEPAW